MKKIYQTPELQIITMHLHDSLMLAQSETTVSGSKGGWVKEDVSSTSRDSYNVWDDDWSKN